VGRAGSAQPAAAGGAGAAHYEELPDREIATLLGCREASVRSLASRGLAALRRQAVPAGIGPEEGRR